jgi:hypothetical protein
MGERIRGRVGVEIKMDRECPQQEEEGEGHAGGRQRLFYPDQDGPGNEEDEDEEYKSSNRKREVKMAQIEPESISEKGRDERQAKGLVHLRPMAVTLLIRFLKKSRNL